MDAMNDMLAASCGHIAARCFAQAGGTAAAVLRGCSERDDRKMLSVRLVAHVEIDTYAGPSTHQGVRSGARRSSGPSRTRLIARSAAGGTATEVDLVGRAYAKHFMRPGRVVPTSPQR